MRTLNATLQAAMDSGSFDAIIRAYDYNNNELQVIYYKLAGTELQIKFYTSTPPSLAIKITRGALVSGVEYLVSSTWYVFDEYTVEKTLYSMTATIIYKSDTLNTSGYVTYQSIIETLCQTLNWTYTPTYKNASAAWLSYKFLPVGKSVITNSARTVLNMLRSKYLVFVRDDDEGTPNGKIFFFSIKDIYSSSTQDYTLTLSETDIYSNEIINRYFIWRDEIQSVHGLPANGPIHNLGYLESTAVSPADPATGLAAFIGSKIISTVNLKYQTGDWVKFVYGTGVNDFFRAPADVAEIFDIKSTPSWKMEITPLAYLANTEGGAMPSTISRVAAYTPLVTTGFNNNLDGTINNLQALAERVDDLNLAGTYTDEAAQDAVGAMVTGNTETGIAVTYDDTLNKLNFVAEVTQAELDAVSAAIPTTEQIQDIVGAMVTGNTETGIAVTYDDPNGKLDFAVSGGAGSSVGSDLYLNQTLK